MRPTTQEILDGLIDLQMIVKSPEWHGILKSAQDEIERLQAAKRAALKIADTRVKENVELRKQLNGNRPLPFGRDDLGRMVREAWVRWAKTQPNPKPSWLIPYDELAEPDKEADRQIGEAVARWTLIGDAARAAGHEKRVKAAEARDERY